MRHGHSEEVEAKIKELLERIDSALKRIEVSELVNKEEIAKALEEMRDAVAEIRDLGVEAREGGEVDKDIIELKAVLDIVAPFLEKLGGILKDVFGTILEQFNKFMDGKKLGEDIGSFYNTLKSMGLPDEDIKEMVRDYYKRRMEAVPSVSELLRQIISMIELEKGGKGPGEEKSGEFEKEKG